MRFIRTNAPALVAGYMGGLVQAELTAGRRVLWLLSGGSGIGVAVAAWRLLAPSEGLLTIGQIDERYGPIGHKDANWQQLAAAGLKPRAGETALPILRGAAQETTAEQYAAELDQVLATADTRIGFLGIGADGHTAGILPHSSALESRAAVASYTGPDFERLTITERVISQLDVAVVYAAGTAKQPQLERLQTDQPAADQPAQLLKQARQAIIFSDSVGEEA